MGVDEYLKQVGKEEGVGERNHLFVENLLSDTDFSDEKIASLAGVTVEFVNDVKSSKAK